MPDLRLSVVGTFRDAHGEEVGIGVIAEADPDDEALPVITIGHSIELGQGEAEDFARLFVRACWEAARQVPGEG